MRHLGGSLIAVAFALASAGMAVPAGAQAPDGATDACKLLTVREVAKTLGQPVGEGAPSSRELPSNQGTRDICTWETQQADTGILSGTRLQLVASVQSNCAPDARSCFKADKQTAEGKHEELDLKRIGGTQAFYVFTGEVEVLAGERILDVHFNNFDTNMFGRKEFSRRTVDAAKRAEKRL